MMMEGSNDGECDGPMVVVCIDMGLESFLDKRLNIGFVVIVDVHINIKVRIICIIVIVGVIITIVIVIIIVIIIVVTIVIIIVVIMTLEDIEDCNSFIE